MPGAGLSSATSYKWLARFGGMDASLMKRLKELEDKNRRLKKVYADECLKAEMAQEALTKKVVRPSRCKEVGPNKRHRHAVLAFD